MANNTPNYNLVKPLGTEMYDIGVPNGNMDIIDAQMKQNADDIVSVSSTLGNSKVSKTGDTMTGDLTVRKNIPAYSLAPTVTPPNSNKKFDMYYNASGANDFGVFFAKDGLQIMHFNDLKDVRFFGHDNQWFSVQDLKQSASDVKTNVAAAITAKGVPTSASDTGAQMAANIAAISGGVAAASGTTSIGPTSTITISGLGFLPRIVVLKSVEAIATTYKANSSATEVKSQLCTVTGWANDVTANTLTNGTFAISNTTSNTFPIEWFAFS